jgi:beta-glucosidase
VACRFGTYSVSEALNAGLDLEMPGPPRWRTPLLISHSLSAGKVSHATITARARSMLAFIQRCARATPEVVFGAGEEQTRCDAEDKAFIRRVASEGMVLLKNEDEVLPIEPRQDRTLRVAVIGPNAKGVVISGGGSAALKPSYVVSPWKGLFAGAPKGVELSYHLGCYGMVWLERMGKGLL